MSGAVFDGVRYSWTVPASANFTFVCGNAHARRFFKQMVGDGIGVGFAYAAVTKEWGRGGHSADTRFLRYRL